MALRLTRTSLLPDQPADLGNAASSLLTGPAFGTRLAGEARARLAGGDHDAFRTLFTRAADHDDIHARYNARVLLVEAGLAAVGGLSSPARTAQLLVAIAEAAIQALEEEPCEPVLLNYAGVALYELWSLDAAAALFRAAERLDPALPHVRKNLDELKRRQRATSQERRSKRPLHAAVPGLSGRAKRVADRAHHAKGMKLSLCMIVRDEEEMLPRCLAAAAPAVDEIIVVDTGSSDRTIEIARSFGARVIEHEWTGSFSEARNVSVEAATGDWFMYLDADEVLVSADAQRLRGLLGRTWREAFCLVETSYTGEADDGTAIANNAWRIFRNRPHYRFEGRLHEQIAHSLPMYVPSRSEHTSIRVEHFGYLDAVRDAKEKSRRNIELLRAQQAESPDTPFLHFNLGTELLAVRDAAGAVTEFERSWTMIRELGDERREWTPLLLSRLVSALSMNGRCTEAVARIDEGLELFPEFTDLVFARGEVLLAGGDLDAAIAAWQRCIEMGDAPARYPATVGTGTYRPRIALADAYAKQGRLGEARELLDWCATAHPEFIGVASPYASVLLRSGMAADEVISQIEQRLGVLTARVRFLLATELYRHGAMEAAESQYRAVLVARPHTSQARVALAEALLHQRRHTDAAGEAAAVADDDPFSGLARRIELWGRIAGGDLDGARTTIERAPNAGVPAADLQMFAGWISLAAGKPAPQGLPITATLLLGVILETLLETHDFEAFEVLLPLLRESALPEREQRELLGSMYLRHGFLASAAQEWMPVCEAEPDARALAGLANVALAHGQTEEAAVFADHALALDPESAAAREVRARCPAPA